MDEHEERLKEESGENADKALVEEISNEIFSTWKPKGNLLKSPIVLMVGGYQGSGKTTALDILQKDNDIIVISPDQIRYKLFDRGIKFSEEFVRTVNATRNNLLKIALSTKRNIAIDQFITPERASIIESIVEGNKNYITIRVLLLTDEDTLTKRVYKRKDIPGAYKGTVNELKASIKKYGNLKVSFYDRVLYTGKLSPEDVASELKKLLQT